MIAVSKVDLKKVDKILEEKQYKVSNLIGILQAVQKEFRYLPEDALTYIGTKIEGLSPATVFGVATFYGQFSLEPTGKFEIELCDGTACHVRGSTPVLDAIRAKLSLKEGKYTTDDGLFTCKTVSCLGACGLAPVMVINKKVYPQVSADAVRVVLEHLAKEA